MCYAELQAEDGDLRGRKTGNEIGALVAKIACTFGGKEGVTHLCVAEPDTHLLIHSQGHCWDIHNGGV